MGRCGRCHPVGTPPSGAVWPLPPRGPSTSRTLMATASRSSSDTSPNLTTENKSNLFFFFIFFNIFLSLSLTLMFFVFLDNCLHRQPLSSVIFYLHPSSSSSPSLLCTNSIF